MSLELIEEALGADLWLRTEAVKRLAEHTGFGPKACQNALSPKGKFAAHLHFEEKWVGLKQ